MNWTKRSGLLASTLILGAIVATSPVTVLAQRDRGVNQPGAAGNAGKIKVMTLDKMAERYKKGELNQIVK